MSIDEKENMEGIDVPNVDENSHPNARVPEEDNVGEEPIDDLDKAMDDPNHEMILDDAFIGEKAKDPQTIIAENQIKALFQNRDPEKGEEPNLEENVTILTNFQSFHPGYSLTGIVKDQMNMLNIYGHSVDLVTNQGWDKKHDGDMLGNATHSNILPLIHLKDYQSRTQLTAEHKLKIRELTKILIKHLVMTDAKYVFTHDLIFTGWNLPYGLAIQEVSKKLTYIKWFHWVHSVPIVVVNGILTPRDWWDLQAYGPNHRVMFPNSFDIPRVGEAFNCGIGGVRYVPHIKDMRTYYEFGADTVKFIKDHPKMIQANIVQVYPASTDRLMAKGVLDVLAIFGAFKKMNMSIFLCIANQWALNRTKEQMEHIVKLREAARSLGINDDEYVLTSEYDEKYGSGITQKMLRELQLVSNLFIFPTREESFGLVGPEAALGGNFMVLNKSLTMMHEVFDFKGLYTDFGSHHNNFQPDDPQAYFGAVANMIVGRMAQNETCMTRTICRQKYNYDILYNNIYKPMMKESMLWK